MEIVVERLQGHNIKPSVQRIAIMKYLTGAPHASNGRRDLYSTVSYYTNAFKNDSLQHAENFERARSCTDADH